LQRERAKENARERESEGEKCCRERERERKKGRNCVQGGGEPVPFSACMLRDE
jgi:hypothetical protein